MSQPSKGSEKSQDNKHSVKKSRKLTSDQLPINDSVRKPNRHKSGVLESQVQKNKITNYIVKNKSGDKKLQGQEKQMSKKKASNRTLDLQEQIREKDRLIIELKTKKQEQEERANKILYQTRQFKKKAKVILARSMLDLAQINRQQRYRKQDKFGSFTNDMGRFTQGEYLTTLKKEISQKEQILKRLQNAKNSKLLASEQLVRITSSFEFAWRQLNELRKQLSYREKELAVYKDRIKLAEKQVKSAYSKDGWPLVYDRFQTLQLLGAGGFGEVYKCYDIEANRLIALKIITESIDEEQQKEIFFKRVQRQAEIQKQLNHPNIVKFYNLIQLKKAQGRIVFELQYCNGIQLSVYLRKHQCLQQRQARSIIKQLFSAIAYLSKLKSKVIHYDLKPNNIMYCNGIAKILDFGLSKVMKDTEESRMDLTSQGVGTYYYLPPQTFQQQQPKISCKVDVWSLGVIFFELLYGQKPFGQGQSQTQVFEKGVILNAEKPVFPKESPKKHEISQSAIQFITMCLQYDAEDRPAPQKAFEHPYLKID